MSICSSVYIERKEAEKRVKAQLIHQHELLVDNAIRAMSNSDLGYALSDEMYDVSVQRNNTTGRKCPDCNEKIYFCENSQFDINDEDEYMCTLCDKDFSVNEVEG